MAISLIRPFARLPRLNDGDRLIFKMIRRSPSRVLLLAAGTAISSASALLLPSALAGALDTVLSGKVNGLPIELLMATLLGRSGATAAMQLAMPATVARSTKLLQNEALAHVLRAGIPDNNDFSVGDLSSRITGNCTQAAQAMALGASAINIAVLTVGGLAGLALVDPLLLLVLLAVMPLMALVVGRFMHRASDLSAAYMAVYAEIATRLTDAVYGIRTIRASGTTEREVERVLAPLPGLGRYGHATWAAYGKMNWQGIILLPTVQVPVLAVAGFALADGKLAPGGILAAAGYSVLSLSVFDQANVVMQLARARAAASRVAQALEMPARAAGTASLPPGPGELTLKSVTIQRLGRTVLDCVSLCLPGGASVAVVGRSAAGKSMLAAVAGGLAEPDSGAVLLDGVPIAVVDPQTLRREVCYAFEQPALLGATVRDAIVFGRDGLTGDQIERAATMARADEFIRRLPEGYDTPLPKSPMSGGELQRIGLTRSFAVPSRLLILDDATSNLDTVTELRVRNALAAAGTGHTRLVVGHRPSTAARCDLVAWLDAGRLRALAPHRELWNDPRYRAVFGASSEQGPVAAPETIRSAEPVPRPDAARGVA